MSTSQRAGLAVAILYASVAIYILVSERTHPGFLTYMGTFLITAPIGLPLSLAGFEPKMSDLSTALGLILANTALFYRVASYLTGLFVSRPPSSVG